MEELWNCFWAGVLLVVIGCIIAYACASKNVDYYYFSRMSGGSVAGPAMAGTCVYAHWTWHADELVFCSEDENKVLDFVAKANATLKK